MESLLALLPIVNSCKDVRTFQQDFVDGGALLKRDQVLLFLARSSLRSGVGWVAMMFHASPLGCMVGR